ncbi:MAG: hypothetical protein GXO74_15860 [Calditrichaeota bacterium]|nr:hypothetical protein [Calditrichota bacterium]
MVYLKGKHEVTLDEKGRLILPSKFRKLTVDESDGQYIVYFDEEDLCLRLYTEKQFDKIYSDYFKNLSPNDKYHREFLTRMGENSESIKIDNQGRIKIPQNLLKLAKIQKQVLIIGAIIYIEIWDPETRAKVKESRGTKGEIDAKVKRDTREK